MKVTKSCFFFFLGVICFKEEIRTIKLNLYSTILAIHEYYILLSSNLIDLSDIRPGYTKKMNNIYF